MLYALTFTGTNTTRTADGEFYAISFIYHCVTADDREFAITVPNKVGALSELQDVAEQLVQHLT